MIHAAAVTETIANSLITLLGAEELGMPKRELRPQKLPSVLISPKVLMKETVRLRPVAATSA